MKTEIREVVASSRILCWKVSFSVSLGFKLPTLRRGATSGCAQGALTVLDSITHGVPYLGPWVQGIVWDPDTVGDLLTH